VTAELDLTELLVGHFDSGLILIRVQDCLDFEPGARLGAANQMNDGLIIDQRLPSPVQTDKRKEPVLDLVPLAGSRRIVTDRDRYPDLIRHLLQVDFPGAQAISVAPPRDPTARRNNCGGWAKPRKAPSYQPALLIELVIRSSGLSESGIAAAAAFQPRRVMHGSSCTSALAKGNPLLLFKFTHTENTPQGKAVCDCGILVIIHAAGVQSDAQPLFLRKDSGCSVVNSGGTSAGCCSWCWWRDLASGGKPG